MIGLLLHLALLHPGVPGEDPVKIPLWPGTAPGARADGGRDKPSLEFSPVASAEAPTAAVVICPGGGYGHLAIDKEGRKVAQWLNGLGIGGFVLDYRHRGKGYTHPAPLQDVQRALRTVRHRAAEWNVAPDRIGVLGFSAGGHLAASAATLFDRGPGPARSDGSTDAIDEESARPDFAVLVYPVISGVEDYAHQGSFRNLLPDPEDRELRALLSLEKQVPENVPPTFLIHADDDRAVPPQNSVAFYLQVKQRGVPAELHIYEKGGHGFGLGVNGGPVATWPERCADWLRSRGLARGGE